MPINMENLSVNQAAFAAMTGSAIVTAGSLFAVVTVASTVAKVASGVLLLTSAGISLATITAWVRTDSGRGKEYFENIKQDVGVAIAATYQFAVQISVQALIQGVALAIRDAVYDGVSNLLRGRGEDARRR